MAKLTEAQRKVLSNLVAGRRATYGFKGGSSTNGGLTGTFVSLRKRGLILPGYPYVITDAGREALKAEDGRHG